MSNAIQTETGAAGVARGDRQASDDARAGSDEVGGPAGRAEAAHDASGAASRPPRVSVGLPVHNGDRYLERAIRSILDQDFTDLELIVVDNASDDGTAAIVERFADADPRVRYHRNAENIGAARNFCLALDLARGRYFKWAAYDDWLEPTYLSACVAVLDSEPDVSLVFPGTNLYDESGALLSRYRHPSDLQSPHAAERFFHAVWNWKHASGIFGLTRTADLRATTPMQAYKGSDRLTFAEMVLMGGVRELPEHLFNSTEATSVRKGRGNAWWQGTVDGRPSFDRWHLLGDLLVLVARTPRLRPVERLRAAGVVVGFFCRRWPRAALWNELRAGLTHGARRLTGPLAGRRSGPPGADAR